MVWEENTHLNQDESFEVADNNVIYINQQPLQ